MANPLDALALGQQQEQQFQLGAQGIESNRRNLLQAQAEQEAAAARQAQLSGLQQQVIGGQQPVQPLGGQGPRLPVGQQQAQGIAAQQQIEQLFPEQAQATQQAALARFNALEARDKQRFESIANRFQSIQGLPVDQQIRKLEGQSAQLQADGVSSEDTDEVVSLLKSGQVEVAQQLIDGAVETGRAAGILKDPAGTGTGGLASAKTIINPDGSTIQALPDGTVDVRDPAGGVVTGQNRLDVLDSSREFQLELARQKAGIRVTEETEKAEAKAGVDLRFKPAIQSAVKLAEKAAAARGEALTALARSEAALPGLIDTIDTLKELAPIATSTLGGKVFDTAVKESGFGATKGSTARAKFIAIVANQVLPLLKETFGAAFTVGEGQELKATMGDPDASPAQKIAQLEAFIAQKKRSIETAQREVAEPLEAAAVQPTVLQFDAQGNLLQ